MLFADAKMGNFMETGLILFWWMNGLKIADFVFPAIKLDQRSTACLALMHVLPAEIHVLLDYWSLTLLQNLTADSV